MALFASWDGIPVATHNTPAVLHDVRAIFTGADEFSRVALSHAYTESDVERWRGMDKVTSKDGTEIAFERQGDGPPVVLIGGAFNDRHTWAELAVALSPEFTAVSYDRRGRGDSGDTEPYAVQREIEDLDAVIADVGGEAFVHGMSSGAALALRAVAAGARVPRLSVMEPPFRLNGAPPAPPKYLETLVELTSTGRQEEAAAYFMTDAVGLPREAVEHTRQLAMWPGLVAMTPTLVYDAYVMGDSDVPTALLASIATPTLAVHSTGSPPWLQGAVAATAEALPHSRVLALDGTFHSIPAHTLAAALADFFTNPQTDR